MDVGKAFSFVFEDEEWVTKVLIAAGILFAGILLSWLVIPAILAALLLSGYGLEITRRVIRGESKVLPAWDNWGALFTDGLMVVIISIVYALPIIILGVCLGVPIGIISDQSEAAGSVFSSFLGCLNFLWAIVMSFLLPAAIAFFAKEGNLGAAFRFGDIVKWVRDHFTTYLITAVIAWVASVVSGLGLLVCLIGVLFTAPYATFVTSYLYGQAFVYASGQPAQVTTGGESA
jgi:hypothetical protein